MITYDGKSLIIIFLFVLAASGLLFLMRLFWAKIKKANKAEILVDAILWTQSIIIYSFFQWWIAVILWLCIGLVELVTFKSKLLLRQDIDNIRFSSIICSFMATLVCITIVPLFLDVLNIVDTSMVSKNEIEIYLNNVLSISGIIFWLYYIGVRPGAPIYYLISPKEKPRNKVEKIGRIINRFIYVVIFLLIQVIYAIIYFRI